MVWNALCISIKGVERMASIWGWHNPLVVRFMEVLIDEWVMEAPVDEIDEAIRECNEERELEKVVPHWDVCCAGIQ